MGRERGKGRGGEGKKEREGKREGKGRGGKEGRNNWWSIIS